MTHSVGLQRFASVSFMSSQETDSLSHVADVNDRPLIAPATMLGATFFYFYSLCLIIKPIADTTSQPSRGCR